jgi:hypothetical protein
MVLGGMIYGTNFMSTVTGFEAILMLHFSNLKGCNAGITDHGDL